MRRHLLGAALAVVALTACAEREVVTTPRSTPTTGTWVLVWSAGALAALVVGAVLTLPAWRQRGGARLAVVVFTVQTGAAVVAGSVLVGVALRSWQLADRSPDAAPAEALLRLSLVDGDRAFLLLMAAVVVVATALLTTVLSLGARLASSTDRLERWVACGVLGLELGVALVATTFVLLGERGWPFLGPALALPVVAAAFATCWPPRVRGSGDLAAPQPPSPVTTAAAPAPASEVEPFQARR